MHTREADRVDAGGGTVTPLVLAAWASLGAGAVHATAVGVHAEHRPAALTFTAVAAFQLLWAAIALARPGRLVASAGAAGSAALVGGWVLAKTAGIASIGGLEAPEALQPADTVAAALAAAVAVVGLAVARADRTGRAWRPLGRSVTGVGVAAVVGLAVPAALSASTHDHPSEAGEIASAHGHADEDGHGHHHDAGDGPLAAASTDAAAAALDQAPAPVPAKPYDPAMPIDLGGVEGVTPRQQAAAENLIAITLDRLPRYADPAVAEADGFRSIRDGVTGHEHYVKWSSIDDEHLLNPDHPESLVYEVRDGRKTLVSAMYMLRIGDTLDDVPELGGPLTQWHIHDDLCFVNDPIAPFVAGLTNPDGTCDAPLVKFAAVPMIHVWIVPHRCGPFASLDGIAAGQIAAGEERLCDHAHGA